MGNPHREQSQGVGRQMARSVAVLISDVHYGMTTLPLSDAAFNAAVDKAAALGVPLIDGGDITSDKASLRAEYVNAMLATFQRASDLGVKITALVGNHSRINERSPEHSLGFLSPYASIVQSPVKVGGLYLAPYFHDAAECAAWLKTVPPGETVIMHQGLVGADIGDYVQDRSAIAEKDCAHLRIISGHYHRHQVVDTGAGNTFTYLGSPFTMSFAEAKDGAKGYHILYDDGSLEMVPLPFRRHRVIEAAWTANKFVFEDVVGKIPPSDLVWLKMHGPSLHLEDLTRDALAAEFGLPENFRLDLIPTDEVATQADEVEGLPHDEIFDKLIDDSQELAPAKERLKRVWRALV